MALTDEAELIDSELQRKATGATIHRIQNVRAILKMAVSLAEQQPTEEHIETARQVIRYINDHCLRKCPCAKPLLEECDRICKKP